MRRESSRLLAARALWCVIDVAAGLLAGFVVWFLLALPLALVLFWGAYLVAGILELLGVVLYCVNRQAPVRDNPRALRFLLAFSVYPAAIAAFTAYVLVS